MTRPSDGVGLGDADLGPLAEREFAAVLFDMDGTLIDSTPSVERSWAIWAGEFGVDLGRLRFFHGVPSAAVIAQVLPPDVRAVADRRLRELEIADARDIPQLPGTAAAMAALAGSGRFAIATSCTADLAAARVAASALDRPPVLVTASDVAHGKPSPDPYLAAARGLGVSPTECLVVEDALAGLAAGKAAGCATLAVTTTTSRERLLASGDADAIVASLADVTFTPTATGVRVDPPVR